MVRLVFMVNIHPNEAFAINVAMHARRELAKIGFRVYVEGRDKIPEKPKGNEIVWVKVPFGETMMGAVAKGREQGKFEPKELTDIDQRFAGKKSRLAREYSAWALYDFHCTSADWNFWNRPEKPDFTIETRGKEGNAIMKLVEIKGYYQDLPKRHLERSKARVELPYMRHDERQQPIDHSHYFTKTTSVEMALEAGVTAKALGKEIAKRIQRHISSPKWAVEKMETGIVPREVTRAAVQRKKFKKQGVRVAAADKETVVEQFMHMMALRNRNRRNRKTKLHSENVRPRHRMPGRRRR